MNGDVAASSEASERRARKPRPEIQIYRPGMLRKGDSTKSLTNEEKPPRPEKLTSSEVGSRRRSNDTDSVTSRGGSGSTTPDANVMNDRGKRRFGANNQQTSAYNSTQSLYDTRRQGGYTEYNGNRSNNRGGSSGGGGGGRYQNQHRQPFERNGGNYSRGFNERASMRGDGAIAKRPSGGRRRNDSINSTQSEMPTSTNDQLHIDTTYDSVSQCGASSAYSMNSLGEAFSFEEMCQNLQSFKSMDWSKEVENDFVMMQEEEERIQMQNQQIQQNQNQQQNGKLQEANGSSQNQGRRNRNRRNRRNDESDRESSFGGSIAEEEEEDEELKSGERTPTSSRASIQPYNPRQIYQRVQKTNNENRRNPKESEVVKKPERRGGYRGEHDDRDDDESQYDAVEHHMSSGRLAGRISIVKREVPNEEKHKGPRQKAQPPQSDELTQKPMQKRSFSPEMSNREALDRKRKAEIDRNEGPRLEQLKQNILKTLSFVKKRDLKAAEKVVKISQELAELYSKVILADIFYSFSARLEIAMFSSAYHKVFDALKSGSNSPSMDAKLIRGVTSKFLSDGIAHYEQLIATYQSSFNVSLQEDLTWSSGAPTEEEFVKEVVPLPYGMKKHADPRKKMALKSMSRLLLSLGDLQRYKALVDGSENYETAKSSYLKSSNIWPSSGHPYNQLGVVAYFAMLYRSGRRARLVPVDVLSRQRQERVIDELFYLTRAIACVYSYQQSKDRLTQRLEQARNKVAAYQPKIDGEIGSMTDDAKEHKMLLKAMKQCLQVYIHPITNEFSTSSGEKLVDDLLVDIIRSPRAQLHRRAVAYMANTFGLLVTKIGMENFANETERALAFFYAALMKPETCFDSQQLTKLAAMFIYAVQINAKKNPNPSENEQLRLSISTLFTIYTILIEILLKQNLPKNSSEYPRKALILLPAINVISTWILHADSQELLNATPLETLPSTILTHLDPEAVFRKVRAAELGRSEDLIETEEVTYPEYVILASFFSMFDPVPVKSKQHVAGSVVDGRILMMMEALKSLETKTVRRCPSVEMDAKEEDEESPRDRKQLIVEERGKGSKALVVKPDYLVPDTNVLIGNLPIIKDLLASKQFTILVPIRVKDELAALAKLPSPRSASEGHDPDRSPKAKLAMEWLQKEFQQRNEKLATLTSHGSKVNGLGNENGEEMEDMNNDDVILSSAVKFADAFTPANPHFQKAIETLLGGFDPTTVHRRTTVLLTGDRGLTIKSIDKNLPCQSVERFAEWFGTATSN